MVRGPAFKASDYFWDHYPAPIRWVCWIGFWIFFAVMSAWYVVVVVAMAFGLVALGATIVLVILLLVGVVH